MKDEIESDLCQGERSHLFLVGLFFSLPKMSMTFSQSVVLLRQRRRSFLPPIIHLYVTRHVTSRGAAFPAGRAPGQGKDDVIGRGRGAAEGGATVRPRHRNPHFG